MRDREKNSEKDFRRRKRMILEGGRERFQKERDRILREAERAAGNLSSDGEASELEVDVLSQAALVCGAVHM